jgi:PAS domain S-box-containing protein
LAPSRRRTARALSGHNSDNKITIGSQMSTNPPPSVKPINVRGTELLGGDTRDQYRQKLARITLDSMVQFVGLLDVNGTVLEINQVALDGVGIKLSDVEGKPFWTTFWWQVSEEINQGLRDAILRASRGEFVRWDTEIYGRASGKETIIIDASLMPVKDEQGNVVFITAEGRDITEKKAQEREIARQREELAKLDVLKTQFFTNISHEFRTPLTLMLGPLEDALANAHGILPMGAAADLSTSHRNALRLLKLVNTMLDFSRIEAGRAQASYQPTDLGALTADLASNFRSLCEKAGLRLIIDCPPLSLSDDAHEAAYVDRDMWEKIVLNLVSNAFKFTLQGEIAVRLETREGRARLTVRDTGVGIPSAELPHIFERFHRIEHNRGRTHEGTGIGLALVQELVKLHGGAITAESTIGEGSTFTVTVPLGHAHLDPDRIGGVPSLASTAVGYAAFVEEAFRWLPDDQAPELNDPRFAVEQLPGAAEPRTEKPRILWADDNADMRAYVSRLLSSRFDVEAVCDGAAALDAARAHPPDLVLSDVMMPKLDGFGLLRALRADPSLREIPIILLSARAGEESRIEGMEAGADDYLVKPFSARELMARVETHLTVSRMRREAKMSLRESEDRFRKLADTAPAILWITEPDASCSFVSRGWYDYTGQSSKAALGFGWLAAVHPEDRDDTKLIILEAAGKREEFSLDFRLRRADGEFRWALTCGRPRFSANGAFAGYIGSVIDVHDRKETALASSLLSAIVESSDDAIISKDLNGVITSWNEGAARLFGYSAVEAIGQSIAILIPPDRLDEEPEILARLRRGERVDHFETIRMRKDGSRLHISLTISPVKDGGGRIIGASKVARDITAHVRQEEALQAANAALRRANADLQQFADSASHDLQEPLRMVAAYSELLKKRFGGQLGPIGDEYIGYTVQGAMRMESLLRDLRMYTQVSTSEQEPAEDVDAGAVLEVALNNLEVLIRDSGASITRGALPRVRMYQFQLEQLFQNLVANAIRYRGNEAPRISIGAEEQDAERGKQWRFFVQDNGIGIDSQFQEQIFGIFKRLHSKDDYPGTGMGLAICQRIVERAGGRIWVESQPGKGSTFYFTVPCRNAHEKPV